MLKSTMELTVAMALVVMLVCSACTQQAQPPPDEAEKPDEPVEVVVAQPEGAANWDPPQDWNTAWEWVITNVYDRLVTVNAEGSGFEPVLAERWERVDELTLRLHLREGVSFHDGTELTAEDVKYHFERVRDGSPEQYIQQPVFQFFEEIVVHDSHTLDFVTPEPDGLLLHKLCMTGAGIVSKAYVEDVGPEGVARDPMGSGPYKLVDWSREEYVRFEANEDYWGEKPSVDKLVYKIMPETSTRLAEVLVGNADLTYGLIPQDETKLAENPDTKAVWAPSSEGWILFLRIKPNDKWKDVPELGREFATADPRVREAIELAIDKYALRDLVAPKGEAFRGRIVRPTPEASPELYGEQANLHNPEKAQELLEEAGFDAGEPTLVFHASTNSASRDIATALTDMLSKVGFDVDLRLLDESTFNSEVYFPRKNQELILLNQGGMNNPYFATLLFHSDYALAERGYGGADSELDNLIEKAWTTVGDEEQRLSYYHEAHRHIAENRYAIGLFQVYQLWGMSSELEFTPRLDNYILGQDINIAD